MITNNNDFIKQKMDFENYVKTAPLDKQNVLKQAFNMYEIVFTSVYRFEAKEPLKSIIEPDKTYSNPLEYAYKYFEVKFLNQVDKVKEFSVSSFAQFLKAMQAKECLDIFCCESEIKVAEHEEVFYEDMYLAFKNLDTELMIDFENDDIELCRETFSKLVNAEPFNDEAEKSEEDTSGKNMFIRREEFINMYNDSEKDSLENKTEKPVDVNEKNTDANTEENYNYDCDSAE